MTTTNTNRVITLNWSNASDYKEVIDSTEMRANTQGGDITSHATLLTVVDNATTFSDAVGSAGTFIIGFDIEEYLEEHLTMLQ